MTDRTSAKKKRAEVTKAPRKPDGLPVKGLSDTDIQALRAELEAARARIAELEQKHTEIINRIDWVIDSLHNLAE